MAEEKKTPWLEQQRKTASRCEKELGRPPKDGYAYRVYGGVCVEERMLPGGTTASDQLKGVAIANRYDQNGKRDTSALDEIAAVEKAAAEAEDSDIVRLSPLPAISVNHEAAWRYPQSPPLSKDSDYVAFNFYKYNPPYGGTTGQQKETGYKDGKLQDARFYEYNQALDYQSVSDEYKTILLYMPEDISTGFRANWGGKAFSTFAANSLRAAGGETLKDKLEGLGRTITEQAEKSVPLLGAAAIRKGLQKITGDSLSNDDVFGAISGAILNPNTELLFEGVDMRNFGLTFKLVPRNSEETIQINNIIKQFKKAMLPKRTVGKVFGITNNGITNGFIGFPDLCRVSFMKGPGEHPNLPKFKMCAITQVDVNYTPDGTYATYQDGQPVAIQLSVNFQETKLVFADDIELGFA